jgi:hypothetical protein
VSLERTLALELVDSSGGLNTSILKANRIKEHKEQKARKAKKTGPIGVWVNE